MKSKKAANIDIPAEDNYLARVVGVVDLDHQPGFEYEGEHVESAYKLSLTYELPTSLMEDGRPHWVTEDLKQSDHKASNLYARVKALDPRGELTRNGQDLSGLLNAKCMVAVGRNKKGYAKIDGVTPAPNGFAVPELQNPPFIFDFENPNMDIFFRLPEFVRNKLKASLNYEGSELEALVLEREEADDKEAGQY